MKSACTVPSDNSMSTEPDSPRSRHQQIEKNKGAGPGFSIKVHCPPEIAAQRNDNERERLSFEARDNASREQHRKAGSSRAIAKHARGNLQNGPAPVPFAFPKREKMNLSFTGIVPIPCHFFPPLSDKREARRSSMERRARSRPASGTMPLDNKITSAPGKMRRRRESEEFLPGNEQRTGLSSPWNSRP